MGGLRGHDFRAPPRNDDPQGMRKGGMTVESEAVDRLQGTDGIRRPVALASDPRVKGLTPQRAFLEKGLLTEEFFELYAYAYVSSLGSGSQAHSRPRSARVASWPPSSWVPSRNVSRR